MDTASLIATIASFDVIPYDLDQKAFRAFLVEVQDCILRMQRDNLDLRRENQLLRRRVEFPRMDAHLIPDAAVIHALARPDHQNAADAVSAALS
jgi:hypothetical protein